MKKQEFTIEDVLRIEQEYILYQEGYTMNEISNLTENEYEVTFNDLTNILGKIDKDKCDEIKTKIKKKQ